VALQVNLNGVTDANTLVTAINNAITATGTGTSQYDTAFKNANITASLNVTNGKTQLTFGSSNAAFQVQAGDQVANALLGNFAAGSTGKSLAETVTAATAAASGATAFANNVAVQIQGSGLAAPVNINLTTANDSTVTAALADLSSQVTNNAALQAAGITYGGLNGSGKLVFNSSRGESFTVATVGDSGNQLGLGTYLAAAPTNPLFNYSSITGTTAVNGTTTNTDTLEISVAGGTGQQISVTGTGTDTAQTLADQLNSQIAANSTLAGAGLSASINGTKIVLSSSSGTDFRAVDVALAANQILGFTGDGSGTFTNGANSTNTAVATSPTDNVFFDAGGATATGALTFNAIANGSDSQTLNFNAVDSSGSAHQVAITLNAGNANNVDQAIGAINTQLQQTNDATLQQITAVKEYNTTNNTYGINFISTLNNFSVGVGKVGNGQTEGVGSAATNGVQGTVVQGAVAGVGSTVDISNVASASAAVTALTNAVTVLGSAQAVVGRGENQFTYAVNLAQSQLTNEQTAESGIRDANLAAEAANLTKAQILIQAGVAALAQANSAPQQVLSLLRS
jgi:flagellin